MIQITKANPIAEPKIGDILYCGEYLSRVELEVQELIQQPEWRFKPGTLNRLIQTQTRGFKGLFEIGVDATVLEESVRYNCPWSDNVYYWMYPLGVISDDEKKYGRDSEDTQGFPWLCRKINTRTNMDDIDPSVFGKLVDAMLGHGYTAGTLPCDGSGEKVLATIPLDNGDELLVACWVWFNK